MSTEIPLKYSQIRKLRDEQEKSFAKITDEIGAPPGALQAVMRAYERKEDAIYRARGKRKNGKAAKPKNGNGNGHKPRAKRTPVVTTAKSDLVRGVVEQLRAGGVRYLEVDLATGSVRTSFLEESAFSVPPLS